MNIDLEIELFKLKKQYFDIALSHLDPTAAVNEKIKKAKAALHIEEEAELPGFENKNFRFGRFENREFVAMMTDIRDSTSIINGQNGLTNMFFVFYIYAGIVAKIVDFHKGTSTEFLGDGILNLFDTKELGVEEALKKSMEASWDIMEARETILNPFFIENGLPSINLGIGIDHGITIVTHFGYRGDTDLKAFGTCAYNVSKLCKKVNQIVVSENSKMIWPSEPGGVLAFSNPEFIEGKIAYSTYKIS